MLLQMLAVVTAALCRTLDRLLQGLERGGRAVALLQALHSRLVCADANVRCPASRARWSRRAAHLSGIIGRQVIDQQETCVVQYGARAELEDASHLTQIVEKRGLQRGREIVRHVIAATAVALRTSAMPRRPQA